MYVDLKIFEFCVFQSILHLGKFLNTITTLNQANLRTEQFFAKIRFKNHQSCLDHTAECFQ